MIGRVPGVTGLSSLNNADGSARDEPGPSVSVLRVLTFRPPDNLMEHAPG